MKIRSIKSTSYHWLIDFIPDPTPDQTVLGRRKKLSKPKIQKQSG